MTKTKRYSPEAREWAVRLVGVDPICALLSIASSIYYAHKAREAGSSRARRDAELVSEIDRVWRESFQFFAARKLWLQLNREVIEVVRYTVERLMGELGLRGAIRGRAVKTTVRSPALPCPADRVNRNFRVARPNAWWVSDSTCVASWAGRVYVAFVVDAFVRRIVGWPASKPSHTDLALDTPEQALYERGVNDTDGLVHHSDRGGQRIRYTERLAKAGIALSVGSVGDSYDAAAETIIGLFKTEVIRKPGPWRNVEAVEFATLDSVDWFSHRRLLAPIGDLPPAEKETEYHHRIAESAKAA